MKKILMMMAIAACAVSAQAKNSTQAQENDPNAIGYQLRESSDGPMTDEMVKYTSVYSLDATTLASKMGVKDKELLDIDRVEKWLKGSFVENSTWIKNPENTTQWTVAKGVQPWLTTPDDTRTALIARTPYGDVSVENNEWVLAFYIDNDGKDFFRVTHAIKDSSEGAKDTVKDPDNVLGLTTGSFVVYNGNNSVSEWGSWTAVPEPTSGMLLLLGLAGLALKRKRA